MSEKLYLLSDACRFLESLTNRVLPIPVTRSWRGEFPCIINRMQKSRTSCRLTRSTNSPKEEQESIKEANRDDDP